MTNLSNDDKARAMADAFKPLADLANERPAKEPPLVTACKDAIAYLNRWSDVLPGSNLYICGALEDAVALDQLPAPITLEKAVERMRELFPDAHTVAAEKQAWWSSHVGNYDRFTLSIQPGFNGAACELFQADSLEEAISAAVAIAPNEAKQGDRNDE